MPLSPASKNQHSRGMSIGMGSTKYSKQGKSSLPDSLRNNSDRSLSSIEIPSLNNNSSNSSLPPNSVRFANKNKFVNTVHKNEFYSTHSASDRVSDQYCSDLFHTLIEQRTWHIVFFTVMTYLITNIFFALWWWGVSDRCDVGITNFNDAFLFSVETMITIGYGTNDQFFDHCFDATIIIMLQSFIGIFLNTMCFTIMYTRVARGETRATSIAHSQKAIIREIDGSFYFMFQLLEKRHTLLLATRIFLFAILDYTDEYGRTAYFQHVNLRLSHPDDGLGSMIFLGLPCMIVHRIDAWSPLMPPAHWIKQYLIRQERQTSNSSSADDVLISIQEKTNEHDLENDKEDFLHDPMLNYNFPEVIQRHDDAISGNRSNHRCPLCGETYSDIESFTLHRAESHPEATDIDVNKMFNDRTTRHKITQAMLEEYYQETNSQVLVVTEGTEPTTSMTVQGRHSYSLHDFKESLSDVAWNCDFAPCVTRSPNGKCMIDYKAFHELVPKDEKYNGTVPPPPSHS